MRRGIYWKDKFADKHSTWKGGRVVTQQGYIAVRNTEHPFATKNGYVREHRLVMEEHIGRYLSPTEIVHHKNEIKTDNRLENLELFSSIAEHVSHHRKSIKRISPLTLAF